MTPKSDIRAEAERLRGFFEAKGAQHFETEVLQPAGALLDLYGEDIRARAFVTHDPLRGEMMLRPDFTVPLVQRHMAEGRAAARYTYAGEVFRRQEDDETRLTEYIQVGDETFGDTDAEEADAEVFATIAEALHGLPVSPVIGDIGIARAAIAELSTNDRRKAALLRHLNQPVRFKALVERFSTQQPAPPAFDATIPFVGLRSREEIEARLAVLAEEAKTAPLDAEEIARLNGILAVNGAALEAVTQLADLAGENSAIRAAVAQLEERLKALAERGIDADALRFEASYLRTSLEYYTGFVFGFTAASGPPIATGGRFDSLTEALGDTPVPAVGGVIRADAVYALREGSA